MGGDYIQAQIGPGHFNANMYEEGGKRGNVVGRNEAKYQRLRSGVISTWYTCGSWHMWWLYCAIQEAHHRLIVRLPGRVVRSFVSSELVPLSVPKEEEEGGDEEEEESI
jgi:hypothetical protein